MISFTLKCIRIWQKYGKDEITVYAAQASFFLMLAFFPFLMLLLTLIQLIPSINKSDLQYLLVRILPDMLDALILGIIDDLYLKSPRTMLSLTALLALWSAARGMMGIERGLNRIYGSTERRGYLLRRLICTGYTFLFMVVCVVSLVLLVFGSSLQDLLIRIFPFLESLPRHVISFRSLLAIVLFLFAFVLLYTIVPAKKQDPWQQLPGAIFAAICWLLFSYGFSLYFSNFSNFSYMYGSLTGVVLLMLWLYFCICILFIGAEINDFYTNPKNLPTSKSSSS